MLGHIATAATAIVAGALAHHWWMHDRLTDLRRLGTALGVNAARQATHAQDWARQDRFRAETEADLRRQLNIAFRQGDTRQRHLDAREAALDTTALAVLNDMAALEAARAAFMAEVEAAARADRETRRACTLTADIDAEAAPMFAAVPMPVLPAWLTDDAIHRFVGDGGPPPAGDPADDDPAPLGPDPTVPADPDDVPDTARLSPLGLPAGPAHRDAMRAVAEAHRHAAAVLPAGPLPGWPRIGVLNLLWASPEIAPMWSTARTPVGA